MTLVPSDELAEDPERLQKVAQQLTGLRLSDLVAFATITTPGDQYTSPESQNAEACARTLLDLPADQPLGEVCFLLLLSAPIMSKYYVSIAELTRMVKRAFGQENPDGVLVVPVRTISTTPIIEEKWSLRVFIKDLRQACKLLKINKGTSTPADAARTLLGFFVERTYIRGLPEIKACYVVKKSQVVEGPGGKLEKKNRWLIETDGSDLAAVLRLPTQHLQKAMCLSNHIHEVYKVLGIDAAAAVLFREIKLVLSFDGTFIDSRHILMIVDSITHSGRLIPMSRHGIQMTESSPLLMASFEQTIEVLTRAFWHGSEDPIKGISEAVMLGMPIPAGTGPMDIVPAPYKPGVFAGYSGSSTADPSSDGGDRLPSITPLPPTKFVISGMNPEYWVATSKLFPALQVASGKGGSSLAPKSLLNVEARGGRLEGLWASFGPPTWEDRTASGSTNGGEGCSATMDVDSDGFGMPPSDADGFSSSSSASSASSASSHRRPGGARSQGATSPCRFNPRSPSPDFQTGFEEGEYDGSYREPAHSPTYSPPGDHLPPAPWGVAPRYTRSNCIPPQPDFPKNAASSEGGDGIGGDEEYDPCSPEYHPPPRTQTPAPGQQHEEYDPTSPEF